MSSRVHRLHFSLLLTSLDCWPELIKIVGRRSGFGWRGKSSGTPWWTDPWPGHCNLCFKFEIPEIVSRAANC